LDAKRSPADAGGVFSLGEWRDEDRRRLHYRMIRGAAIKSNGLSAL
jgi:hypothetical protein